MKKIPFVLTIFIHLVGISAFSFSLPVVKHKKEERMRIVTREIPLSRPSHVPAFVKETPIPHVVPVIKKEIPPPKKTTPVVKKAPPKKEKIPRAQVKKKLEKAMVKMPPAIKNHTPIPEKKITPPSVIENTISSAYLQSICALLEDHLTLPESGIVKLTITVQANGKIGMVKEVSSESRKNLVYLKEMLENFSFPSPDGEKEVEFTITFCGDS